MTPADFSSLDTTVHGPIRLGVLTALRSDGELDFTTLKKRLHAADGAMGTHLKKLEAAGYVATTKAFVGRRPKTTYRLTTSGQEALDLYARQMRRLLVGADERAESQMLGDFEHLVLVAILRCAGSAFTVDVSRELDERTGRSVSRGTLYRVFDDLEAKGLLTWEMVSGGVGRGGRPRRRFSVTPEGLAAAQDSRDRLLSMWEGLAPVLSRSGQ